jgi:mRNA interferase MazF
VGRRVSAIDRGEIWLTHVGKKTRPVLILTRPEVLDVRTLVTVAEITTQMRGLAAEVGVDHTLVGLQQPSAINCDGLHTIAQSALTKRVGAIDAATMDRVCRAISYALGC